MNMLAMVWRLNPYRWQTSESVSALRSSVLSSSNLFDTATASLSSVRAEGMGTLSGVCSPRLSILKRFCVLMSVAISYRPRMMLSP